MGSGGFVWISVARERKTRRVTGKEKKSRKEGGLRLTVCMLSAELVLEKRTLARDA